MAYSFFFKSNLGIWTQSLSVPGLTLKESLQKWLRELIWAKQTDQKRGGSEKQPGCGSCMSRPLWVLLRAVNTDAGLTHGRACGPSKPGWIMRHPQRLHRLNTIMSFPCRKISSGRNSWAVSSLGIFPNNPRSHTLRAWLRTPHSHREQSTQIERAFNFCLQRMKRACAKIGFMRACVRKWRECAGRRDTGLLRIGLEMVCSVEGMQS